jgi:hypothetical protein
MHEKHYDNTVFGVQVISIIQFKNTIWELRAGIPVVVALQKYTYKERDDPMHDYVTKEKYCGVHALFKSLLCCLAS